MSTPSDPTSLVSSGPGWSVQTNPHPVDASPAAFPAPREADPAVLAAVTAEHDRAVAAEGANASAVATELARAELAESANATATSDEVTRAELAESALSDAITALTP